MVKLVFLCRRRADITHADYARLLLDGHVPLALKHHPTMRQYIVNIVEAVPAGAPELDSIGALYFDDLAEFRERLYDSPAGARIIARDVQGFMGGAHAYATTEHVHLESDTPAVRGERSPGTKLVCLLERRAGMTHAEFIDYWVHRYVPQVLRATRGLTGHTTSVVDVPVSDDAPPLDAIAEFGFRADAEDAPALPADAARCVGQVTTYRVGAYLQKHAG